MYAYVHETQQINLKETSSSALFFLPFQYWQNSVSDILNSCILIVHIE